MHSSTKAKSRPESLNGLLKFDLAVGMVGREVRQLKRHLSVVKNFGIPTTIILNFAEA